MVSRELLPETKALYEEIHDIHQGQTCLVIGNGPSLMVTPSKLLKRYMSFGTNRIYLRQSFYPTYWACVNPLVLEQWGSEAMNLLAERGTQAFFIGRSQATEQLLDVVNKPIYPLLSVVMPHFTRTPWMGIWEGHTVTYICLQLAHWMGFSTALLVGVDHRYTTPQSPDPNREVEGFEDGDPNHFHPDYFGKGAKWHTPDLGMSEVAYRMAKAAYELDGREIINLTPETALEIFEQRSWEDYC